MNDAITHSHATSDVPTTPRCSRYATGNNAPVTVSRMNVLPSASTDSTHRAPGMTAVAFDIGSPPRFPASFAVAPAPLSNPDLVGAAEPAPDMYRRDDAVEAHPTLASALAPSSSSPRFSVRALVSSVNRGWRG